MNDLRYQLQSLLSHGKSQALAGAWYVFSPSKPHSRTLWPRKMRQIVLHFPPPHIFRLAARQLGSLAQFNLRISHPLTSLTAVLPQQMKDGVILDNDEDRGGDTCKTALHASHFCLLSSVTL